MEATFILKKEVVDDLFIRENEFKSFIKFIKKNFRNYTLITNYDSEQEFIEHSQENPILEILLDRFKNIKYLNNLDTLIKDKTILNYSSKRCIVICDFDHQICADYSENKGILFFNLSSLKNWNLFEDIIYAKSLKVTNDSSYPINLKFRNFDDITKYLKFCDSIIIFDKFIFENKTNQRIIKNLFPLLESALKINNNLDIMIVSEFKEEEITNHHKNILDFFSTKGYKNFKLNLIHHEKAFYPRKFDGLHSRCILSNYIHIRSNDSFNFFKDNGEFNNLADIDIKFNLTTDNSYSYLKDLEAIKVYLSKIKNNPNCPNKAMKITYFKDNKNQLVT